MPDNRRSVSDNFLNLAGCRRIALVCAAAGLCLPLASFAQATGRHGRPPHGPSARPLPAGNQPQAAAIQQEEQQPVAPVLLPPPAPPTPEHTPSRLPTVTFQNGELTIVAYNATLRDILEAVHSATGAMIDIPPDANERVAVRLGPGPVRRVLDSLLVGSAYNYVMLGSAADPNALAKVVLSAKPSDASDKGTAQRGAQVLASRRESVAPVEQAETSVPATEVAAQTVSKQENSAAQVETQATTEGETERANSAAEVNPHTPNIKSAQEVLQDLYARRRQAMEQQNQQPQTPR